MKLIVLIKFNIGILPLGAVELEYDPTRLVWLFQREDTSKA